MGTKEVSRFKTRSKFEVSLFTPVEKINKLIEDLLTCLEKLKLTHETFQSQILMGFHGKCPQVCLEFPWP